MPVTDTYDYVPVGHVLRLVARTPQMDIDFGQSQQGKTEQWANGKTGWFEFKRWLGKMH